jgi:hypothetical protein
MADGFLSRWSRRKSGKLDKSVEPAIEVHQPSAQTKEESKPLDIEASPPVTLEDVEKIDRFAPDFSAFMKPDVDPAVQQAALKKMFTDPHFNVMDGLDIYIDDYSKPDPLPPGMLERMVQGDMLKLFRNKPESEERSAENPVEEASLDAKKQALIDSSQSDLTSTDTLGPQQSNQLDKVSIKSNKNKT